MTQDSRMPAQKRLAASPGRSRSIALRRPVRLALAHRLTAYLTAGLIGCLAVGLTGCSDPADADRPASRPARRLAPRDVVAVASGPAELVARALFGPDKVDQVAGAEADWRADTWRPSDDELARLVDARAVLTVGAEFEPWAQRAGLPPSRSVVLAAGLDPAALIQVGTLEHTHGGGESHSHGGQVPTFWTDPDLLEAALGAARPALSAEPAASSEGQLQGKIQAYRDALADLGPALGGRRLLASGHGLEYIARAAKIELEVCLVESDASGRRDDGGVRDLEASARAGNAAPLLVWLQPIEDEFAKRVRSKLGLTSLHFDTGGAPQADASGPDTLDRLTASVRSLSAALRAPTPR